VRPQLDETDPAFQAVERAGVGIGWARICRHGQEKIIYSFPPHVQDVDVKALNSQRFNCPLWREGNAADGAGRSWGVGARVLLVLPLARDDVTPAVAVVVHSAVDAAAAMRKCVQEWTKWKNLITVDPATACVSYQQGDTQCIIFSVSSEHPIQFVQAKGLPPSFVEVQQVHRPTQSYRCTIHKLKMRTPEP